MSNPNAIWRLKEGLARDERIAREAARLPGPTWESYISEDYPGQYSCGVQADCDEFVRVDYEYVSDHIAEHDPARVLRQVEAHRRILARHHPIPAPPIFILGGPNPGDMVCAGCGSKGNGQGLTLWPCPDVQDLAGIYTDPTDTEGGTKP